MIEYMVQLEMWPEYPCKEYSLGCKWIVAKDFQDLKRKIWKEYGAKGCDIYVALCVECHYRQNGESFSPFWIKEK